MNVTRALLQAAIVGLIAVAPQSFSQSQKEESREQTVTLSQVPQAARDAAQKALGAAPTEAKVIKGTNPQQYELEAKTKAGKEMSVHVTADGKLVKKPYAEKDED
jgi:hypothetical protein